MTSQFERRSIDGPDGRMEYLVGGEGTPLVCLHPSSGVRVNPATEALAQHRRIYLPIAPGFDGTPDLDGVDDIASLADRFSWLLGHLFDSRVDLTGHSVGGWIACWLAVNHPQRIGSLVLQCPAGLNPRTGDALKQDPSTFLQRAFAHPEKRPPETKPEELVASNRARSGRYQGGITYDAPLVDRLSGILSPTLIVYGRKDGVVPPETASILKERIPNSDLFYVEDAAHNIEIDQPEIYVDAVLSFLAKA